MKTIPPARVLLPVGLATALSLMGDATVYTVLPTHTAAAGITLGSVGLMLGANRAVRVLLNGPAGLAYDRWPRRRLFVPAVLIGALSTALYTVRGFWPTLTGRLLWGLAWSGIWVGGATMILDVTTDRDRGRWLGLYQTWFFVGAAAGSLLGGLLTDWLGYVPTMWIGAAVTALGGIAALVWLPETRGARQGSSSVHAAQPDLNVLANRGVWAAVSLYGMDRFVFSGLLGATIALLVEEQLGGFGLGVATLTGVLSAGRTAISMGGAPLAGAISDWSGDRWQVAAWSVAAAAASMALTAWRLPAAILAGVGLGALARGGIQTLATALMGDLVTPALRGRAIGLLHTAGDIGSAAGPLIAYAVLPTIGLQAIYGIGAGLFLLQWAFIVGYRVIRAKR